MSARRNKRSLCKTSTMIAMNFMKLSSLCLAKISLGAFAPAATTTRSRGIPRVETAPVVPPNQDGGGGGGTTRRLEETKTAQQPSYLMEPSNGKEKAEDNYGHSIDEMADKYIEKIRERNRIASAAEGAPNYNPPPPYWNNIKIK